MPPPSEKNNFYDHFIKICFKNRFFFKICPHPPKKSVFNYFDKKGPPHPKKLIFTIILSKFGPPKSIFGSLDKKEDPLLPGIWKLYFLKKFDSKFFKNPILRHFQKMLSLEYAKRIFFKNPILRYVQKYSPPGIWKMHFFKSFGTKFQKTCRTFASKIQFFP